MRARKPKADWRGQIGMDVGEQRKRAEPESSVADRVRTTLEAVGCIVRRWPVGLFKTMHGTYVRIGDVGESDFVCFFRGGVTFFVETKRGKGGVITDEQHAFVENMRALGFVAGFAREPEEALELFREATQRRAA